ncbi:hypothetical protein EJ08DRAFT_679908 [Tothia fuscella]|uniref:Uncharacterized protein n=1 Tax=Tothia fuscella TaxID=1048955 RepID=A0A9P4TY60_9PEZI|nr:hypothetical protein EJ08DRAFT_679908 [Tothia fuscella]
MPKVDKSAVDQMLLIHPKCRVWVWSFRLIAADMQDHLPSFSLRHHARKSIRRSSMIGHHVPGSSREDRLEQLYKRLAVECFDKLLLALEGWELELELIESWWVQAHPMGVEYLIFVNSLILHATSQTSELDSGYKEGRCLSPRVMRWCKLTPVQIQPTFLPVLHSCRSTRAPLHLRIPRSVGRFTSSMSVRGQRGDSSLLVRLRDVG